jgi:hypothetical protein
MAAHHWWSWLVLALVIGAPWLAAIAWVLHVTPPGDGSPPQSWGSYLLKRSSIR